MSRPLARGGVLMAKRRMTVEYTTFRVKSSKNICIETLISYAFEATCLSERNCYGLDKLKDK
jgi:hypothetical protein